MISWYIKCSGFKSEQYLKKVEETVEPLIEWFIDKISDVEEYDIDKIEELYNEIFDELPVMRLHTDGNEIWLEYNKDTNIIFVDPKKSIRRDIILNNLFKDENYK